MSIVATVAIYSMGYFAIGVLVLWTAILHPKCRRNLSAVDGLIIIATWPLTLVGMMIVGIR